MYAAYFGLKENPFKLTPEPRYLFLSEPHRDVLLYLAYGIKERKGFVLISGGIGTGKTTICRTLLDLLDSHPSVETALIFNTAISDLELLEAIVKEFGIEIPRKTGTKKAYVDALNDFLLKNFAAGKNAVLLIDEAQNLSHSVLEQIRMLSNLETEKEKLLQIILIGQPELKTMLTLPALQQLNDRITVRYDLIPLSADEVIAYIEHRLRVAGGPGKIKFTKGAYRAVYDFSEGVPRRINALCDRAFLIAYAKNISKIDRWVIRHAARDIGSEYFQKNIGIRRKSWLHLNT
jgi:general secretion pathway protein A